MDGSDEKYFFTWPRFVCTYRPINLFSANPTGPVSPIGWLESFTNSAASSSCYVGLLIWQIRSFSWFHGLPLPLSDGIQMTIDSSVSKIVVQETTVSLQGCAFLFFYLSRRLFLKAIILPFVPKDYIYITALRSSCFHLYNVITILNICIFYAFYRSCGWGHVSLASNHNGPTWQSIRWGCVFGYYSFPSGLSIQTTQGTFSSVQFFICRTNSGSFFKAYLRPNSPSFENDATLDDAF